MTYRSRFSLSLLSILFLTLPAFAQLDPNLQMNTDEDNLSEIVAVSPVGGNKDLVWVSQLSSSGYSQAQNIAALGRVGDNLIPANWLSPGLASIGTVSVNNAKNVVWSVSNGSTVSSIVLGTDKTLLVSGADLDGSGIADAVSIQKNGSATIETDPFVTTSSAFSKATIALKMAKKTVRRGTPFFASQNGTSDSLGFAVLKKNKKGRAVRGRKKYQLTLVDIGGGVNKVLNGGNTKGSLRSILPVAGADGVDRLAFVAKVKRNTVITVRTISGDVVASRSFPGNGTAVVGQYLGDAGEELGYAPENGAVQIWNAFSGAESTYPNPASIIVDHVNINSFTSFGSNSGGSGSGGGSGIGSVCKSTTPRTGGFLWKPDADADDARKNKPVVLFTGGSKTGLRSIDIYATNGEKICNFTFKPSSIRGINGGADHYFSGWIGGCALTDGQIAAKARAASGNSNVFIQWKNGGCLGPINPTTRVGGI